MSLVEGAKEIGCGSPNANPAMISPTIKAALIKVEMF